MCYMYVCGQLMCVCGSHLFMPTTLTALFSLPLSFSINNYERILGLTAPNQWHSADPAPIHTDCKATQHQRHDILKDRQTSCD